MLLDDILKAIPFDTEIPKPAAKSPFRLLRVGVRRGERALIYSIPSHTHPDRPYEKGVTESELERSMAELERSGELTRAWFNEHLKAAAAAGGCNFTTIGGLLELLGRAKYAERSTYVRAE